MVKWLYLLLLVNGLELTAAAQPADAPYKRFPTLPPIQLLLGDSTTKYTKADIPKNKPVVVMVFSPECTHCRQMAGELPKFRDQLKGTTIVMATMYGLTPMNEFSRTFNLSSFDNVVVGKDMYFLLPPFYGAKNLPFFAFYDKKGKLLSVFEGSLRLEEIVSRVKKKG
jgi:thioredoxin-related protein